ncbi:MAG: arylesterase [Sulfurospirillaceae bacterium]|nr:arylesterase [Sulfurospirillaceae bacterium]MDD2826012.1 arylesterase [Sulfurospirillaceae bacterium]
MNTLVVPLDTKVLAFGDSLTFGYGVSRDKSYPSVLANLLHTEVINEGISGEMSEQGLLRLPAVLEKYKPNILVLCHGANDILRKRDLVKMKENLSKMITMAQEKGIYVLLVGVPTNELLTFSVPSLYYDVAQSHGIEIEDKALSEILGNDTLKSDQVHPNEQGYRMMALNIAQLLSDNYHPSAKTF